MNVYIGIGYIPATIGEYTSVGGCLGGLQAQAWGMCIFWNIHLIGYILQTIGEYMPFKIYILVLDIFCQQLGDICHLVGVCAHFGGRVMECEFSKI